MQRQQVTWSDEIFSRDPKVLVGYVDTIGTAQDLNSYVRRFRLARLAKTLSRYCCR